MVQLNCYLSQRLMMWNQCLLMSLVIVTLYPIGLQAYLGLLEREQASRALPIQMDMNTDGDITICTGLKRYIACRDGSYIAVTNAFWGRTSDKVCPSDDGDPVTDCEGSEDTLGLVKGYCESKNECQLEAKHTKLQKNGTHHCPGVNKYLIVNYTCIPESKGVTLCDSAETVISCPSTWTMVLIDIFWGRRSNTKYCGTEEGMECDSSESASKYLKGACDGKKRCLIKAESALLDTSRSQCAGMLKYLMVNYVCKPISSKAGEESDDDDSKILSDTSSKELMGLLEKHLNEIKTPETNVKEQKAQPMAIEEKKIEPKQFAAKSKTAGTKSHTRNTLGRTNQGFVANEEEEIANSLLNGPAFARAIKKQDVTIPLSKKDDSSVSARPRKDEIFESIDNKDAAKKNENSLFVKDTITKSDDTYEVTEPNTVRSILARAKEVLKTLDGDSNANNAQIIADTGDDILNKRGGIAHNRSSDEKIVNDTASAVKQVANLAQSLVKNAAATKTTREGKGKKGFSNKMKEETEAATYQKPKPGSTKKLGYRAGTGSAGVGNTP